MHISKLQINRYRSIREPFLLENPGKLHIFIGANNAGKTNIIDAIKQLYHDNPDRTENKQADINIEFNLTSDNDKLIVKQKNGTKAFCLNKKRLEKPKAQKLLSKHIIRLCATSPNNIEILQKEYQWMKNKSPEAYNTLHNTLRDNIPFIPFNEDIFSISDKRTKKTHFDELGNGFQQVFVILMYFYHPQYTILLLEEPEIHLHPALVTKLISILEQENRHNQIFLTTHSPLFIHTTNLHRIFRVVRGQHSTRVYSPRLAHKRIDYTRLKQELNAENCEMFFADKVLLVEGSSDKLLLRGLINRFYKTKKDIKVIQVYGKSNIDVYADLLSMFNLPYTVLLDRDAIYDTGIHLIQKYIKEDFTKTEKEIIAILKRHNIFVLPNGSIENNYPRKYQRKRGHKPRNALYAAAHINEKEYYSKSMANIREVIHNL